MKYKVTVEVEATCKRGAKQFVSLAMYDYQRSLETYAGLYLAANSETDKNGCRYLRNEIKRIKAARKSIR